MNILFIGGVADGELRDIPEEKLMVEVCSKPQPCPIRSTDLQNPPQIEDFVSVGYKRMEIKGKYELFSTMVVLGMTWDEAIKRLLDNYMGGESKNE